MEDTIDSTNTLTISGGTVENLLLKTPDYRQTAPVNSITGGTVTGTITTDNDGARVYPSHVAPTGFITGGAFDNQPDDAFLSPNAPGTYLDSATGKYVIGTAPAAPAAPADVPETGDHDLPILCAVLALLALVGMGLVKRVNDRI